MAQTFDEWEKTRSPREEQPPEKEGFLQKIGTGYEKFRGTKVGGIIDYVLQAPEYGFAGYLTGARRKAEEIAPSVEGAPGKVPGAMFETIKAGIKNIPTGLRERTDIFDYLEEVEEIPEVAKVPLGFIASIGIPAVPISKISKFTGLSKAGSKFIKSLGDVAVPGGKYGSKIGEFLSYRYGQPEKYAKAAEQALIDIGVGSERAIDLTKPLRKLPAKEQQKVAELLKTGMKKAPKAIKKIADPIREEFKILGAEAVKEGLLDEATYLKNLETYFPRMYRKFEKGKKILGVDTKPIRVGMERFMKRKDLPEDVRKALGEIEEAGYPTAKGLAQLGQAVTRSKFFRNVAKNPEWVSDVPKEGFELLPTTKRLFTAATGKKIKKLTEAKILVKLRNETTGLIKRNTKSANKLMTEINRLNIEGLNIALKKEKKITKATAHFRKTQVLFESGKGAFTKVKKYPSPKKLISDLIALSPPELKRVKKMVATRENRLTPFFDEIAKLTTKKTDLMGELAQTRKEIKLAGLDELSGKYVLSSIHNDIQQWTRAKEPLEKILNKVTSWWKFGKVVANPATHSRNIGSNVILAHTIGGLSPTRVDVYGDALVDLAKKGDDFQEAKKLGLLGKTFYQNEIAQALDNFENGRGLWSGIKKTAGKLGNLYSAEEDFFKLALFKYQKSLGKSPEAAAKIAERALFNYSKVPPFIDAVRKSVIGMPFATFAYKATPALGKAFFEKPTRFAQYQRLFKGIEKLSDPKETEEEKEVLPDWMEGINKKFLKIPLKDKYGRSQYLDLSYILPWYSMGGQKFFQHPVSSIVRDVQKNKDYFGNEIYNEKLDTFEEKTGKIAKYIWIQLAPPLAPGGYAAKKLEATIKGTPDYRDRTRSPYATIFDVFFGFKTTPIEAGEQRRWRKQETKQKVQELKAQLNKFLRQKGVSSEEKRKKARETREKIKKFLQRTSR